MYFLVLVCMLTFMNAIAIILDGHNCQSTANPQAIAGVEYDVDGSKLKKYLEKERIEFRKRV